MPNTNQYMPPSIQPSKPQFTTPPKTKTHRKLDKIYTKTWINLILGLGAIITVLYVTYFFASF